VERRGTMFECCEGEGRSEGGTEERLSKVISMLAMRSRCDCEKVE